MLGMTIDTKAARGYVGAGPRYSVVAARGRGAARRGAREAAGPHVSAHLLKELLEPRGEFARYIFEQRRVLGGSGSVIESDGLENLRAALIFSQHQAVLLRWDFSIFQGSRVSAHGDYYSVVIIFSYAVFFFRAFLVFSSEVFSNYTSQC